MQTTRLTQFMSSSPLHLRPSCEIYLNTLAALAIPTTTGVGELIPKKKTKKKPGFVCFISFPKSLGAQNLLSEFGAGFKKKWMVIMRRETSHLCQLLNHPQPEGKLLSTHHLNWMYIPPEWHESFKVPMESTLTGNDHPSSHILD